jgi:uncharacterized protein YjbI with pentapeptide repeats
MIAPALPAEADLRAVRGPFVAEHRDEEVLLTSLRLDDAPAPHMVLARASLQEVSAARADWSNLRLRDTRCRSCDLSSADWSAADVQRTEFLACRLTGLNLSESSLEDVLFRECTARLAQFYATEFRGARFEQCDLKEAYFGDADLRGVVFRDCDLTGADLSDARLEEVDLRGSVLAALKVSGPACLRGAIVDPAQAAYLAGHDSLLGLQVRPDLD